MIRHQTLVVLAMVIACSCAWIIEGPSEDIPQTRLHSAYEAHLFRNRLLSALRQVDPTRTVSDSVLNNFRGFSRNYRNHQV